VSRVIGIWQGGAGPPARDDRFVPVVALVQARGLFGRPLLTPRCRNLDQADDVRRGIYLAARYFCSCGEKYCTRKYGNVGGCPDDGQRVSVRADVVRDDQGALRVQCTFFDKTEATREIIRKYGPDPALWPYQAKAKKLRRK
jgi:hypothetical protein